ncbi:response regulator [Colwellia sp. MB02u-10]|uniref:response regulator n=1 Tax=Colwellia sp. MB02u-10 TaxID=2759828 RepID=UPI0015F446E5|nr:response regulator [Colwellia sp. MB02u-10]MBA6339768.1 response regulator [Colwellia sp. MB02u-10]
MTISILICDDSNVARKQLQRILPEGWAANSQIVKNGQEALDVLRTEKIDLLFLDLTMPVLDGFSVLKIMQAEAMVINTIVISADIQDEAKKIVEAAGALDFIRKPISATTLIDILKKHKLL